MDDGTNSLIDNVTTDENFEIDTPEAFFTSEQVTKEIKAATDPVTKQLERLCELTEDL